MLRLFYNFFVRLLQTTIISIILYWTISNPIDIIEVYHSLKPYCQFLIILLWISNPYNLNYDLITEIGLQELSISFCFDCETWVYICVTLIELCPNICWIYRISTFLSSSIVAKLCLNIWGGIVIPISLASATFFNNNRTLCSDNFLVFSNRGNKTILVP